MYRREDQGIANVKKATRTFSETFEKVTPIADTLADKFEKQKHKPDEVTVEFGLKLGGETNLVIAAASVEAHLKLLLSGRIKIKNSNAYAQRHKGTRIIF